MRRLVQEAVQRLDVTQVAHDLVRELPGRDARAELGRLLAWVRDRLRYTNDPVGPLRSIELVKAPWAALEEIERHGRFVGDCDDAVVLLAALLGAVGRPVRIVAGPVDAKRPLELSHVWLEAWDGERWTALDPIMPGWPVGRHVDPQDLQGRPRYLEVTKGRDEMSGVGFAPATGLSMAVSQSLPSAAERSFWDEAGDFVGKLSPLGKAYLDYKAGGSTSKGGTGRPVVVQAPAAQPGFFQKRNPQTGALETNWVSVGMVAGGAALVGLLVFGGARRRRR